MKIHIVQKGDTLWKIAEKYNVDFEQLKATNTHLTNPDMIMPGIKIKIPTAGVPVKKEAPVKEMPKQPVKEVPKEKEKVAPSYETPKKPTIPILPTTPTPGMFYQPQPVTNQQQTQELNMNVNIYKQQKPKMGIPPVPEPPAPPKKEKPKEKPKKPAIPKAPLPPKDLLPCGTFEPIQKPIEMPQPIYEQPQPCPPLYPVSPVLSGCAPCGSSPYYGQQMLPYTQVQGQLYGTPPLQQQTQHYGAPPAQPYSVMQPQMQLSPYSSQQQPYYQQPPVESMPSNNYHYPNYPTVSSQPSFNGFQMPNQYREYDDYNDK